MMGVECWPHLLQPTSALVAEMDLPQLLKQLPPSHFSLAIRPAHIGDTLGMAYSHQGANSLEPATSELGSTVAANGTGDAKDC